MFLFHNLPAKLILHHLTAPLPAQDFYAEKSLAHVISAVATPDEVFVEVAKALDPLLSQQKD